MLAHAAAQGLPHAGRTQWYALSAASMSLVAWHGARSNGRYAALCVSVCNDDNLQVKVVVVEGDERACRRRDAGVMPGLRSVPLGR